MRVAPTEASTPDQATPAHDYDLFIVYAAADAAFVRDDLLPALGVLPKRVLLVDELPLGGGVVDEIDRGVSRSRYTVAVLSPAYLEDRWAMFGEQLASHLSVTSPQLIPLKLAACRLPVRLDARVSLDFRYRYRWKWETERLRNLLRDPEPGARQASYPDPFKVALRRAIIGTLLGAMAGGLLVLLFISLRPKHPLAPPLLEGMARFPAATVRLGVFDLDARPKECSTLAASEDCAVIEHPENTSVTHLESFDLDRLEITNAEFATWLNANVDLWKVAPGAVVVTRGEPGISLIRTEKCGDGLTITPENRALVTMDAARRPIVCVAWHGANEYCRAHDKRLPLEAEWELAAKGAELWPFPWGAALPRQDGVAFELRAGIAVHPRTVGTSPQDVSPAGVHDMGGNVAEWVEDRRGNASEKSLRGGSFASIGPCHLLGSGCRRIPGDKYQKDIGFRCARSVNTPQ